MFYSKLIVVLTFVVGTVFFAVAPTSLHAQAEALTFCPLENNLIVGFRDSMELRDTDGRLADELVLINNSEYIVQGMSLAIAWYTDAGEPSHAVILANDVALAAKEQTVYSFSTDVSTIPAGTYTMRPLLVAGDEVAVLGHIINGGVGPGTPFSKNAAATPSLTVTTNVGGEAIVPGSALSVEVITTNLSPTPILEGKVVVAISNGDIPLGEAVKTSVIDSLKLFPGSRRTTALLDPFVTSGTHAVTSLVLLPNVVQAVMSRIIIVGESTEGYSFSYLSGLGFSAHSDSLNVSAVACISETNPDIPRSGESLELTSADFSQMVDTLPNDTSAVAFTLPSISNEAAVTLALLAPRERALATNQTEAEALDGDGLVPVQTISFFPECERFDICFKDLTQTAGEFIEEPAFKTSIWFYLGIMLAALLLQLVILRRLPVTDEKKVEMTKPKL